MIDFRAQWFSKFLAPNCLGDKDTDRLQVICNRDIFLQSFNSLDDHELEFIVELKNQEEGTLKVVKTREYFIVEAYVHFTVDSQLRCEDNYVFPDD